MIDEKLTFERHRAPCASKASVALTGVRLLSNARSFLGRHDTVQLVRAIALPCLDWLAATWFEQAAEGKHEWSKNIQVAEAVHQAARVTVTGAFKSVATDTMEVEGNITPICLRLRGAVACLGLRAAAADTPTGAHLRAITTAPPSLTFTRYTTSDAVYSAPCLR